MHSTGPKGKISTPVSFLYASAASTVEFSNVLCAGQTVAKIRHALDSGEAFPEGLDAHDMANALLSFFIELPMPLIPESVAEVIQYTGAHSQTAGSSPIHVPR